MKRPARAITVLAALATSACLGLGLAEELVDVKRYVCGNGDNEPYEECDDGNTRRGDGCDPDCQLEVGWVCSRGSECVPRRRGEREESSDSADAGDAGASDAAQQANVLDAG